MLLLTLCLLCASALALVPRAKTIYSLEDAEKHFEEFIITFDKRYASEDERNMRFDIFKQNLVEVNQRNSDPTEDAVFGITHFMDMTVEESLNTGIRLDLQQPIGSFVNITSDLDKPVPATFDWRDLKVVSQVKNQGHKCGSCWSFSATGVLESKYAIVRGDLFNLSEQQAVDCDKKSFGCSGGFPAYAIQYIVNVGGIESETSYPYTGVNGKCKFDKTKVKVAPAKLLTFNLTDEDITKKFLYNYGPIAIVLDATLLLKYKGGILKKCPDTGILNLNHAVLLVGYGQENDIPFWIIKNSWGTKWGEEGYIRLGRYGNPCGLMNPYTAGAHFP